LTVNAELIKDLNGNLIIRGNLKLLKVKPGLQKIILEQQEDPNEWIDEWRKKFPSGDNPNNPGFTFRGSRKFCIVNMTALVAEHPAITKQQIIEATDNILEHFQSQGYKYLPQAHYVIMKLGKSMLYEYIEKAEKKKINSFYL